VSPELAAILARAEARAAEADAELARLLPPEVKAALDERVAAAVADFERRLFFGGPA
jgi:hypothetical protein